MKALLLTAVITALIFLAGYKVGQAVEFLDLLTPSTQSGCGVVPVKPVVPVGCKDLKPQCVCDQHGKNCAWQWVCVPN